MVVRLVYVSINDLLSLVINLSSNIEYASDIKEVIPSMHVTLLHSRMQLLPRFDNAMHEESEIDLWFCLFLY